MMSGAARRTRRSSSSKSGHSAPAPSQNSRTATPATRAEDHAAISESPCSPMTYAWIERGSTPRDCPSIVRSRAESSTVPEPTTRPTGRPENSCARCESTSTGFVVIRTMPPKSSRASLSITSRMTTTFRPSRSRRDSPGRPPAPAATTTIAARAASDQSPARTSTGRASAADCCKSIASPSARRASASSMTISRACPPSMSAYALVAPTWPQPTTHTRPPVTPSRSLIAPHSSSSFRRAAGEVDQLVYARAYGPRQQANFVGLVVGRAEDRRELAVGQAREPAAYPARVLDAHLLHEPLVLAREVKIDVAVLDLVYELRVGEGFRVVAAARDAPEGAAALLAEGRAEVADDVAQLRPSAPARRVYHDVVLLLQVPVVEHHHQDLQALKLARAREGVLLPAPLVEPLDVLRPRLEAHVLERAPAGDGDARDEVRDLRDVARGPHESHRGRLALRLLAELRNPLAPRAVAHAELLRPAALLLLYQDEAARVGAHGAP